jgi:hypothetical protein
MLGCNQPPVTTQLKTIDDIILDDGTTRPFPGTPSPLSRRRQPPAARRSLHRSTDGQEQRERYGRVDGVEIVVCTSTVWRRRRRAILDCSVEG